MKHLGKQSKQPTSPNIKILDKVKNNNVGSNYVIRLIQPEFTCLCPITGQPDFAHIVIDYIPNKWIFLGIKLVAGYVPGAGRRRSAARAGRRLKAAGPAPATSTPAMRTGVTLTAAVPTTCSRSPVSGSRRSRSRARSAAADCCLLGWRNSR